jgi:hypothetical protein
MIELPRRSVTRFFIPLIDVLTLMFCIFLLMPVVESKSDPSDAEAPQPARSDVSADRQYVERQRREIDRLRRNAGRLAEANADLERRVEELQKNTEAGERHLAIRVLEIGDDGRLVYYDPERPTDRRIEITERNVESFLAEQKGRAGSNELYLLLMYPRPANGTPTFPLRSQREAYDRWFQGVAHSYDIR